jgi:hypothetical protein
MGIVTLPFFDDSKRELVYKICPATRNSATIR